jgi:hydrogenase maturation protein HypF
MAAAYLGDDAPGELRARHDARWGAILSLAQAGMSSPLTSSAGRLFDATAAALGIRDAVNYEGQAAIELEQRADPAVSDGYPMGIDEHSSTAVALGGGEGAPTDAAMSRQAKSHEHSSMLRLAGEDLLRAATADLAIGVPVSTIAARFHNGLAGAVVDACTRLRDEHGLSTVALSGGVFQNLLLLGRLVDGLEARGFHVLVHSRVPPNDGGISLGQAAVTGALDRAR